MVLWNFHRHLIINNEFSIKYLNLARLSGVVTLTVTSHDLRGHEDTVAQRDERDRRRGSFQGWRGAELDEREFGEESALEYPNLLRDPSGQYAASKHAPPGCKRYSNDFGVPIEEAA